MCIQCAKASGMKIPHTETFSFNITDLKYFLLHRHPYRRKNENQELASEEFLFERLCSLPHSFTVRRHTDAVKLTNAHLFCFKFISFKKTQFCRKQNKYLTNSFLLIENIFVEFRSFSLFRCVMVSTWFHISSRARVIVYACRQKYE